MPGGQHQRSGGEEESLVREEQEPGEHVPLKPTRRLRKGRGRQRIGIAEEREKED